MSSPFPPFPNTLQKPTPVPVHSGRSLLKRAVFGLVLLVLMVSGGAWLMDAGIDRSAEAQLAWPDDGVAQPSTDLPGTIQR
jgi:hypothetical protein